MFAVDVTVGAPGPGQVPAPATMATATRCSIRRSTSATIPMCSRPASMRSIHFNTSGFHEGRDPNAFFDTSGYLAVNQDVAASGVNPLDHYHQVGWKQGRDPCRNFDTTLYLINNPDVAAAGIDPLEHFLQFGQSEGRQAYAAIGQSIVGGFDAAVLPVPQSGRRGGRRRSAVPLQRRRLARGAQSERLVRHGGLSLALRRRRGRRHQSAAALRAVSAGRKAATRRPASTRSAIWRRTRTSRRRTSIRSIIS